MSAADDKYNRSDKGRARYRAYRKNHLLDVQGRDREYQRRRLGWYEPGGMATAKATFKPLCPGPYVL